MSVDAHAYFVDFCEFSLGVCIFRIKNEGMILSLNQGLLTWGASTPRGAEINFKGCWEGHICGGQR